MRPNPEHRISVKTIHASIRYQEIWNQRTDITRSLIILSLCSRLKESKSTKSFVFVMAVKFWTNESTQKHAGFDVVMAGTRNSTIFLDLLTPTVVELYRCFEGTYRLHLQSRRPSQGSNQQEAKSKHSNCFPRGGGFLSLLYGPECESGRFLRNICKLLTRLHGVSDNSTLRNKTGYKPQSFSEERQDTFFLARKQITKFRITENWMFELISSIIILGFNA
jgi:hypothetical protein